MEVDTQLYPLKSSVFALYALFQIWVRRCQSVTSLISVIVAFNAKILYEN